jgi:hypothetical protein
MVRVISHAVCFSQSMNRGKVARINEAVPHIDELWFDGGGGMRQTPGMPRKLPLQYGELRQTKC